MSNFIRILKQIGRLLRRAIFAIGRFFKFAAKSIAKAFRTSNQNKRIKKNQKAIGKLYTEIGQSYYEAHKDAPEDLLSELCGDVSGREGAIAEAVEKIETMKQDYAAAKAEANEKARARRAADKEKARAEKAAAAGVIEDAYEEAPEVAPAPVASEPVFTPAPAPEPVGAPEPEPVVVPTAPIESAAPVVEETFIPEAAPITEVAPLAEEVTPVPEAAPVAEEEPAADPEPIIEAPLPVEPSPEPATEPQIEAASEEVPFGESKPAAE